MSTNAFTYTQPLNAKPVLVGDNPKVTDCCNAPDRSYNDGDCYASDLGRCPECGDAAQFTDEAQIFEDPAFASEEPYKLDAKDFTNAQNAYFDAVCTSKYGPKWTRQQELDAYFQWSSDVMGREDFDAFISEDRAWSERLNVTGEDWHEWRRRTEIAF